MAPHDTNATAYDVLTAVVIAGIRLAEVAEDPDATGDEVEDVAAAVHEIARVRGILAELDGHMQDELRRRVHTQQARFGPWRLERHGGSERKNWDSDGVFSALIRQSNADPETGEVFDDGTARDRLIERVRACVPLTASLGWRARALKSYALDPDEFCEKSRAPFTFTVTLDAEADAEGVAS